MVECSESFNQGFDMIRSVSLLLATVAGLSAGSAFAGPDFTVPVDKDFWEGDVTWDGFGKGYEFLWILTVMKDQMVVCGAGKYLDASNRANTVEVLRKAKVKLDGKTILTDLTFFTKLPKAGDLMSAKATCRSTGMALPKGAKHVEIEFSGRYRF